MSSAAGFPRAARSASACNRAAYMPGCEPRQCPASCSPMKAEMDLGTDKKAFQINLDANKYGTFAEIGAGQEVARRFFYVGGAAGTVAKTMSAYDMTFSDAIYGSAQRYVSRA